MRAQKKPPEFDGSQGGLGLRVASGSDWTRAPRPPAAGKFPVASSRGGFAGQFAGLHAGEVKLRSAGKADRPAVPQVQTRPPTSFEIFAERGAAGCLRRASELASPGSVSRRSASMRRKDMSSPTGGQGRFQALSKRVFRRRRRANSAIDREPDSATIRGQRVRPPAQSTVVADSRPRRHCPFPSRRCSTPPKRFRFASRDRCAAAGCSRRLRCGASWARPSV